MMDHSGPTGNGISNIEKTSETSSQKNYRINYTNGNYFDYSVENGEVTQAQLDEVIELNERILNNTPKGSTNTNPAYINDSADLPLKKFVLKGKTEQFSTTGKQLFNISNITAGYGSMSFTTDNDKLVLTSTGATGSQFVQNYVTGADALEKYTISYKAKKVVNGTAGEPCIYLRIYGSNDGETYTSLYNLGTSSPTQGTEYSYSTTVTGYSYYRFYIYNNIGGSVTTGEKTEYYDIQFEKGEAVTSFEPYTRSEYQVLIQTIHKR